MQVMRTAAGFGRIRNGDEWPVLEEPTTHVATQAWATCWAAVRRQYNKLADDFTTRATHSAVIQRSNGNVQPHIWMWIRPGSGITSRNSVKWFDGVAITQLSNPFFVISAVPPPLRPSRDASVVVVFLSLRLPIFVGASLQEQGLAL